MSNTFAPNGFRPARRLDGAAPTYGLATRLIAQANANSFGQGDIVKSLTTGFVDIAGVNDSPVAAVFWGCTYYDTTIQDWIFSKGYHGGAAAPSGNVLSNVFNDPKMVFEAQSNGAAIGSNDINANAKFVQNGAPNFTMGGVSTAAINATGLALTATFPLRIIQPSPLIGNDNSSAYNMVEVSLNAQDYNTTTGLTPA